MAKQRLFPKTTPHDEREPQDKFEQLASKVLKVPKSEINEREKQWRKRKPMKHPQ
jgi:hypothetical protein